MKKMMLLGACLLLGSVAAQAQESRQDVSISGFETISPDVYGNGVYPMHSSMTTGVLASYRYMVTPRSALEVNYGFSQYTIRYKSVPTPYGQVHTRMQEVTGAYVYSRTYRNWNPFAEVGVGGLIFTPILDNGTHQFDSKQNTNISGLAGVGVAYEISPSFDIRAEYRGFILKTPDFGNTAFKTNRYYWLSEPTIGIAYHF
ncbi:porin family protein [Granulicella cerasi]|uniref:Porin family protein n=1 Tax=Granulicella cerasi TaxID=741063 RepID=A0ABW1Z7E5_9BACT|nr:porin family protein [Granulicella cerasi]